MKVHGHGVEQAAALAGRFVEEWQPGAVTAFLGGSRALVDESLLPYGGQSQEGFRQEASAGWRSEGEVL